MMTEKVKISLALVFLVVSQNLFSSEWKRRATGPSYAEYFGDVKKIDGLVRMSMLTDYIEDTEFEKKTVKSIINNRLFNCKDKTTKVDEMFGYSEQMGMGELVSTKKGDVDWERIEPDTFLEYALILACR